MTIDSMIDYIKDHDHDSEITEAIIAVLRAAQQMRDTSCEQDYIDGCAAFDAATGEDR